MSASSDARERLAGAIWGMFLGDAHGLAEPPNHRADAVVARVPAGRDAPGALTHAGAGALILLESLAEADLDAAAYGRRRVAVDERPAGGPDDDMDVAAARLAPLVARLAGDPRLMLEVDRFTRTVREDDRAVAVACTHARLLELLFAGAQLDDALDAVMRGLDPRTELGAELRGLIDTARAAADLPADLPVEGAVEQREPGSRLGRVFAAALQATLVHADDPLAAVVAAARTCGNDAGRAMLVGSWLGARHGLAAWPEAWRAELDDRARIAAGIDEVLRRRHRRPQGPWH